MTCLAALSVLPPGPQDMPGVLREAYRAMGTGSQLVSKGRQGAEAANRVQVSPPDSGVLCIGMQQRVALQLFQEHVARASCTECVHSRRAAGHGRDFPAECRCSWLWFA